MLHFSNLDSFLKLVIETITVINFKSGVISDTILNMDKDDEKILKNPKNVRFEDLKRICQKYFGEPRNSGRAIYFVLANILNWQTLVYQTNLKWNIKLLTSLLKYILLYQKIYWFYLESII